MYVVYSKNNVPIRLTEERWFHIIENHDELAGRIEEVLETVADPDIILAGVKKEFLAARKIKRKYLVVVYKEENKSDGFIITAFKTSKIKYLLNKRIIWRRQ